jgi:hypothetical protein
VMRILRASCAMALAFHPTTSSNRHVGITKWPSVGSFQVWVRSYNLWHNVWTEFYKNPCRYYEVVKCAETDITTKRCYRMQEFKLLDYLLTSNDEMSINFINIRQVLFGYDMHADGLHRRWLSRPNTSRALSCMRTGSWLMASSSSHLRTLRISHIGMNNYVKLRSRILDWSQRT